MTDKEKVTNVYEFRAFPHGKDRYDYFMENNLMSLGWQDLDNVSGLDEKQIRDKIRENHPGYPDVKTSQIAGFFKKLKNMKKGDILLIPYIKPEGPIITIAVVTEKYHYDTKLSDEDMAQQIGIKRIVDLDREELAEDFPALHNSLKARLSITKIDRKKHRKAIAFIESTISANTDTNTEDVDNPDEEYVRNIKSIRSAIKKSNDEINTKALLLSALVINESYVTKRISAKLTQAMDKNDDVFYNVVKEHVINQLFRKDTRDEIADEYFDNATISKNYSNLRNALAHNIMSVKLENKGRKIVFYKFKKPGNSEVVVMTNDMFKYLEKFPDEMREKNLVE